MGFLSFLSGKKETPQAEQERVKQKNFDILKYDGLRAQRMGRMDYAVKCFTEALALQPDFETMGYLAQTYMRLGETDKARSLLNDMAAQEPTHIDTWLRLSQACYQLEDYAAMADAARKVTDLEPGNAMAHYLLARADHGLGDELMCIAHLTQAIMADEHFAEARLLRAETLMKLQQPAEARADIEALLAEDADNESALLLQAKLSLAEGNAEAAIRHYRHVISQNPFCEQAYEELGAVYMALKRPDDAKALLEEALEINPNFGKAADGTYTNQPEAPAPAASILPPGIG